MNKNEYLDRLSKLLADISYEEHEAALSYYREYIEDAGSENEQRVIEELGTPEHLAAEICEGLSKKGEPSRRQGEPISAPELNANNNSENRSNTYQNNTYQNSNAQYSNYQHSNNNNYNNNYNDNRNPNAKQETNHSTAILIIILLLLTSPLWLSLVCSIIAAVFTCIVGFGAAGVVCIITGIMLIVAGAASFFSATVLSLSGSLVGTALIGAGFIALALGIAFIVLTVWLCGWALPAVVRFIRQTISSISCKKKEANV